MTVKAVDKKNDKSRLFLERKIFSQAHHHQLSKEHWKFVGT